MGENKKEESVKTPLEQAGFVPEIEEEVNIAGPGSKGVNNDYINTGWPKPIKRYRLVFESYNASIEETYFWILNHLKQDQAYNKVIKLTDNFTASENSSFWGVQQQRLGLQQDKVSQYLAVIGKMTKELFQVVREVRILKERLQHYDESKKGLKSADIALKGYWVDLVEGGGKNPASIYGLASQLGFATLPDLFFSTFIKDGDDIDKVVENYAGGFNRKVKEVLRRKLYQFVKWRQETHKELISRHKFTLRYLRQHWNSIRLYITWVKPYLKNVKRLQTDENYRDDPELISSIEGAIMDIELLAQRAPIKGVHPVILGEFNYRTRPAMNFSNEYQRGPIHVGRISVTLRAYAWTANEIEKFKKFKNNEDLELLTFVDESIKDAMDALGDDLHNYLLEAYEDADMLNELKRKEEKKEEKKVRSSTIFEPFTALFGGFKDMLAIVIPSINNKKKVMVKIAKPNRSAAAGTAIGSMYQTYKNYKKSHGMLTW